MISFLLPKAEAEPRLRVIKTISPEWTGFNWPVSQLRNRFPVIKPSISASIQDIIGYLRESERVKRSKLVCSSLNIVKLILEMTLAVLVRTVVERIKAINRPCSRTTRTATIENGMSSFRQGQSSSVEPI